MKKTYNLRKIYICNLQCTGHKNRPNHWTNLINYFDFFPPFQALEIEPTDKNCLVARSKCYLQLGDSQAALKDAEASLSDDDKYIKVQYYH